MATEQGWNGERRPGTEPGAPEPGGPPGEPMGGLRAKARERMEQRREELAARAEAVRRRLEEQAARLEERGGAARRAGPMLRRAADTLGKGGEYLRTHRSTDEIRRDVEERVRAHPVRSVALALAAGLVLGRVMRG